MNFATNRLVHRDVLSLRLVNFLMKILSLIQVRAFILQRGHRVKDKNTFMSFVDTLTELWVSDLLPEDRKLKALKQV